MANKVRITYNAPVTLNFSLVCALVLIMSRLIMPHLILVLFSAPARQGCPGAFNWTNPIHYLRLFTHVFGHAGWNHLVGNLAFILLLGPLLEERYGSRLLLLMIMVTAFVTGILSCTFLYFLDRSPLIHKLTDFFNALPSMQHIVNYYKQQAAYFAEYAAKLMEIDIEQFKQETALYISLASNLENAKTEQELNTMLYTAAETIGMKIPWHTHSSFDSFMKDKNARMVFE